MKVGFSPLEVIFLNSITYARGVIAYFAAGDMIKLFKVKEKQRELAENASNGVPTKKQSAGELRLHKGFGY